MRKTLLIVTLCAAALATTEGARAGTVFDLSHTRYLSNPCMIDTGNRNIARDVLVSLVQVDSVSDPEMGNERASRGLQQTSPDSVVQRTDSTSCAAALHAIRMHRFNADTGWLSEVLVFLIKNRYVIYAGDVPFSMYYFDDLWTLIMRT